MKKYLHLKSDRSLAILSLVVLIWITSSGLLWFLLPQLSDYFVNDVLIVGILMSLPGLVAILIDIPLGDLCDKLGRKKIIIVGLLVMMVLGVFLGKVNSLQEIVLFLLLLGISYQLIYVPSIAYVMDISPRGKSSEYFGVYMACIFLGYGIGPFISGYFMTDNILVDATRVGYIFSIGCFMALLIAIFFLRETITRTESTIVGIKELIKRDKLFIKELRDYGHLRPIAIVMLYLTLLFTFFDGAVWTLEPLYYKNINISPLFGGIILGIFSLSLVIFDVPSGILAERYRKDTVLITGLSITGISLMIFGLSSNILVLISMAFLSGLGLALAWPSTEGILFDISGQCGKGEISGIWNFSKDLGYFIGPLLGGVISSFYKNIGLTFTLIGLVFIISIILVLPFRKN